MKMDENGKAVSTADAGDDLDMRLTAKCHGGVQWLQVLRRARQPLSQSSQNDPTRQLECSMYPLVFRGRCVVKSVPGRDDVQRSQQRPLGYSGRIDPPDRSQSFILRETVKMLECGLNTLETSFGIWRLSVKVGFLSAEVQEMSTIVPIPLREGILLVRHDESLSWMLTWFLLMGWLYMTARCLGLAYMIIYDIWRR